MAEINDDGYTLKTENEYFEDEKQLYLDIDPDWGLDPSTPDGLKIAADAELYANLDEVILKAYNSKDPNKARGAELDAIGMITGASRSDGTPSTVTLTLYGVSGTFIPAGFLVESSDRSSQWATDTGVSIESNGQVDVGATCTVDGVVQAAPDTITRIVDSVGGWEEVTNQAPATPGTDRESDAQFRVRRALLVQRASNNQLDSMRGEVGSVDGVRRFKIYENDEDTVDANGLPGHSIAVVVDGGSDADVAMAMYLNKNPGVKLHALNTPVTVTVTSPVYPDNTKDIVFCRPTYVDMNVTLNVNDDGSLPSTIADELVTAILDYVTGDLVPAEYGFRVDGFDIGEDVPIGALYTPINNVIGKYGNSYVDTLDVNGVTSGLVTINANELSRWTDANILVTIL